MAGSPRPGRSNMLILSRTTPRPSISTSCTDGTARTRPRGTPAPTTASAGAARTPDPAAQRRPREAGPAPVPPPDRRGLTQDERGLATRDSVCIRCDRVDGFPCLLGGKADAQVTCVDPALQHDNVRLVTRAHVIRLETDGGGRAVTAVVTEIEDADGGVETVRFSADVVVLAAGAVPAAVHGRGDRREGTSQADERGREQRRPTSVHRRRDDRLAGELGERARQRHLQRMVGLTVRRHVPPVEHAGGQHPGVLARAVHGDRLPATAVAQPGVPLLVVERDVGRCLQRRGVQPRALQDPEGAVDVHRLPGVRRAGEGQQVGRQVEPLVHHADGLQGLVARTRQHRRGDVADRPLHRAVGRQRDDRPVVVALDETRADDLGDDDRL